MKTLRLSDEDYQALLEVLQEAASDARSCEMEWGYESSQAEEADRLYDLIKPVEYEHTLESEQFHAIVEATSLLKLAGVPVTLTNGDQRTEL